MKVLDDFTSYDIGEPFLSVRIPQGSLAHTPNGIVVNLNSGTRYTCSYNRLLSALKINAYNPDDVAQRDNINDICDKFRYELKKMQAEGEKRSKQIEELLNKK